MNESKLADALKELAEIKLKIDTADSTKFPAFESEKTFLRSLILELNKQKTAQIRSDGNGKSIL